MRLKEPVHASVLSLVNELAIVNNTLTLVFAKLTGTQPDLQLSAASVLEYYSDVTNCNNPYTATLEKYTDNTYTAVVAA